MDGYTYNKNSVLEKYDDIPTSNSTNLVNSGHIKTYVDAADALTSAKVDSMIDRVGNPFVFKGTVAATSNLPSSGNTVNDTYFVEGEGFMYTWDGSTWHKSSTDVNNQLAHDIATEYSETKADYKSGDIVMYNNQVYVRKTDATAAEGTFVSANWTATSIGDELSEEITNLKSAFVRESLVNPYTMALYKNSSDKYYYFDLTSYKFSESSSKKYIATKNVNTVKDSMIAVDCPVPGIKFRLIYFDETGEASTTGSTGYLGSTAYQTGIVYFPANAKKFLLGFTKEDNTVITDEELDTISSSIIIYYSTDTQLNNSGKSANSKVVGEKFEQLNYFTFPLYSFKFSLDNCEIGSIYSDSGNNYNGVDTFFRLKSKTFFKSGTIFKCKTSGYRFRIFKYSDAGIYDSCTDFITSSYTIEEDGYYRFIFGLSPQGTTSFSDLSNFIIGGALTVRLQKIENDYPIERFTINVNEGVFNLRKQKRTFTTNNYSLPSTSISSGLESRQDIAMYNDNVVILFSNNYAAIINKDTGAVVNHFSISSGHGNSCQFATKQFDDINDDYPLLYCFAYNNNYVYVNKIENTGATLIKRLRLDGINGYRFSGGVNKNGTKLFCIYYHLDSSTNPADNYCLMSTFDLNDLSVEGEDYIPELINTVKLPYIYMIQGCCYHDGYLYVSAGSGSDNLPYKFSGILCIDMAGGIVGKIAYTIDSNEPDGIEIYNNSYNSNEYEMYFCTNKIYRVKFDCY